MNPTLLRATAAAIAFCSIPLANVRGQSLVRDINTSTSGTPVSHSDPGPMTTWNGTTWFFATRSGFGRRLWKTDGTAAGTAITGPLALAGVTPGAFGPDLGSHMYFTVDNGGLPQLWRTDGTDAGTALFLALSEGPRNPVTRQLVRVGGQMFFRAHDTVHGEELWVTDGTAAGTHMTRDLLPGPLDSVPNAMIAFQGRCFFASNGLPTSLGGRTLWASDGTEAGTVQVGPVELQPSQFAVLGSQLFFSGRDASADFELWSSDGTPAGTSRFLDLAVGASSAPRDLVAVGGQLFFTANDVVNGRELWVSDGTVGGTNRIDLVPGALGSDPAGLSAFGNRVLFAADDGASGVEPWISDGTVAGTYRLADVAAGASSSDPRDFRPVGALALFSAIDPVAGREPWVTDGTPAGTFRLRDVHPGAAAPASNHLALGFCANGTFALFAGDDGAVGNELWRTDGTTAGTQLLLDLNTVAAGSSPTNLLGWRQRLYFAADDGIHGRELWTSDGTTAGTQLLVDLAPGAASSNPEPLFPFDDRLVFLADQVVGAETRRRLHATDGSAAGTTPLPDLGGSVVEAVTANGQLVALTRSATSSTLWALDALATVPLATFSHPGGEPRPGDLVVHDGAVWFRGLDAAAGAELWRTDGTAAGTVRVHDLRPGTASSRPEHLTMSSGRLYFTANDGIAGTELWMLNGAAPTLVKDLTPGPGSSSPERLVDGGTFLAFETSAGLHRTDGTALGTYSIYGMLPLEPVTRVQDRLFFSTHRGFGSEPWVTDGTLAGTQSLGDLWAGGGFSMTLGDVFAACGSSRIALFSAHNGVHGNEPWITDGTEAGTHMLADLDMVSPIGSYPRDFTRAGATMFFSATVPGIGRELYAVRLVDTGATLAEPYGSGCPGTGGLVPRVAALGEPTLGNPAFALQVEDGFPGSFAMLALSAAPAYLVAGGCHYEIALPPLLTILLPTDPAGGATLPLPIPNDPALRGVPLFLQFGVFDPAGSVFGIASHTHGIELMING
ncbi:MAG: ELWxxDGT repeat protein [Planctomycetota bacterium]